jgi:hypothetical protein
LARSEASVYRKTQRMIEQTHAVPHGPSILESLEWELSDAAQRYVIARRDGKPADEIAMHRGEIRGLARAVARMRSPYQPRVKQTEKDFVAEVREKLNAQE